MDAIIQHLYSDDMDDEVYFRESSLEFDKMHLSYLEDSILFTEDGDDSGNDTVLNKIATTIQNMIDKILAMISGFFKSISSGGKEKLDEDMYLNSDTAEIRFAEDIQDITKQIENQILQERKCVQMLAKAVAKFDKTGTVSSFLDDRMIASLTDTVKGFTIRNGGDVLKATAIVAIGKSLARNIDETKGFTKQIEENKRKIDACMRFKGAMKNQIRKTEGRKILGAMETVLRQVSITSGKAMATYKKINRTKNQYTRQYAKTKK